MKNYSVMYGAIKDFDLNVHAFKSVCEGKKRAILLDYCHKHSINFGDTICFHMVNNKQKLLGSSVFVKVLCIEDYIEHDLLLVSFIHVGSIK